MLKRLVAGADRPGVRKMDREGSEDNHPRLPFRARAGARRVSARSASGGIAVLESEALRG